MLRWLALALWIVAIMFNSSIPAMPDPDRSLRAFLIAKAGHVVEYLVLGWMILKLLVDRRLGFGLQNWVAIGTVMVVLAAVAGLDETRQLFVYSRSGSPFDAVLDSTSGLIGALLSQHSLGRGGTSRNGGASTGEMDQGAGREREHEQVHRQDLTVAVNVRQESHHDDEMQRDEGVQEVGAQGQCTGYYNQRQHVEDR